MWKIGQRISIDFLENQEFIVVKHMAGGMGNVFKVVDSSLLNFYCIKTMKQSMPITLFKKECEIWLTASSHSNCVKPVAYGLVDGKSAIAYTWYASTLSEQNLKTWTLEEIVSIISTLVKFFDFTYRENKILHCDIKPSNILIDKNKQPFVTDFGISRIRQAENEIDQESPVSGTREYMAPELLFGVHPSIKTELYSFGITIYELLTGSHPYLNDNNSAQKNARTIDFNFQKIEKRHGKRIAPILEFVKSCISIQPSERPNGFVMSNQPKSDSRLPESIDEDNHVNSIIVQASFYRKERQYDKAEQILHSYIASHTANPIVLNALGSTYILSKSRQEAIVHFKMAAELVFESNGFWQSNCYLDPVINLCAQYIYLKEFDSAFYYLKKAFKIFEVQPQNTFKYSEFGWMMLYENDFDSCCHYLNECFKGRAIQPVEMLWFTEAAWISGNIKQYANSILCKVVYTAQFDASYFLCAFLLSKYASHQEKTRLFSMLTKEANIQIERLENETNLPTNGLRPPLGNMHEALIIHAINDLTTGGKHHPLISQSLRLI